MKNANFSTLSICAIIILAIAFAVTGVLSYRAYSSSSGIEKVYLQSILSLKELIDRQDTKIASLSKQIAVLESRLTANFDIINSQITNKLEGKRNDEFFTLQSEDLKRLKQTMESSRRELLSLKQIIESTGLDQLAKTKNIDPNVLKELYDSRIDRNDFVSQRNYLLEQNKELHLADNKRYDEELDSLYRRARFRIRREYTEDSNKAFEEMLTKYPDAYATAMAIGERALFSIRSNTPEAEKYYKMLQANQNESYSNVITDQGIEVLPNIEYFLARQYVRQGRLKEADTMLKSIEVNYSDSLLFFGRRGRWQPISQAVARLRNEMK